MSTIYSVTQLNQQIKDLLESHPVLHNVFVRGEISNYKLHSSGHHYMTLKDEGGAVNAVLFRAIAARLRFRLQSGIKIIARGRISSFPKTGQVQFYITDLMPDGIGDLHIAFEQLKERLQKEGLFDQTHKFPIPVMPRRIAIITSPTGAAVHDMLRILGRRWPLAKVVVFPALVQGDGATESIAHAIQLVNAMESADVILCGRGGGSMEDLWAFNEETVARAIYASNIPIVSAVGHEPDFTIADFVADLRAPTPSGAAELAVPNILDYQQKVMQSKQQLSHALTKQLRLSREWLTTASARLASKTPKRYVQEKRVLLDYTTEALHKAIHTAILRRQNTLTLQTRKLHMQTERLVSQQKLYFSKYAATLDALSPLKVLARGYSISLKDERAVTAAQQLQPFDMITVRFATGEADCSVITTREGEQAHGNEEKF